jgi:hypothetical protein
MVDSTYPCNSVCKDSRRGPKAEQVSATAAHSIRAATQTRRSSRWIEQELDEVALSLNNRPQKALCRNTPPAALDDYLESVAHSGPPWAVADFR